MTVKLKLDGVECEVSELAAQLIAKQDAQVAEKLKAAVAEATAAKARADVAEGKVTAAEKAHADAIDPKRIDEAVARRVSLIDTVKLHLGAAFKADGKTEDAIKREVLAKVAPSVKLDSADAGYVGAAFDAAVAVAKPAAARPLVHDTGVGGRQDSGEDSEAKAREDMKKAHKGRLPSLQASK
jgi:hypothetical protein